MPGWSTGSVLPAVAALPAVGLIDVLGGRDVSGVDREDPADGVPEPAGVAAVRPPHAATVTAPPATSATVAAASDGRSQLRLYVASASTTTSPSFSLPTRTGAAALS